MSQSSEARKARRQKRLTSRGDRQFFAAVRKIRRDPIDKWQMENKPKRFALRFAQLTNQATKRDMKQMQRDTAKAASDAS